MYTFYRLDFVAPFHKEEDPFRQMGQGKAYFWTK